jgi:ribonuclease VapC
MASTVPDASALLAYLHDEPGADVVADAVADGAAISTVNLGEVLSRVADRGGDPARVLQQMSDRGLLDGAITLEPFTRLDAQRY